MLNDQPTDDDLLGRRPFAESVAKVIALQSDPAPQVIAIDGVWGEGKTTVFLFLEAALKKRALIVVNFNPWRHNNEDQITRAFLLVLAEALGCDILKKHDHFLEWAQGKVDWIKEGSSAIGGENVGKFLDFSTKRLRPTVEVLSDRLRGELNVVARRVTILIDDPDRLDGDELMGLFRLIKLIASFEWITFVLAMDCDAVAKTVGKRFGGDVEGRRFLEKIVQVPLRLPAVPHVRMLEFALQLVQQVIADSGVELSADEVRRFRNVFDGALMPFIKTPRLAKQYSNILRFALGFSDGEVNTVDVILLEAIRLLLPESFIRLIQYVAPAVDRLMDEMHTSGTNINRAKAASAARTAILPSDETAASKWALNELLSTLFPQSFDERSHNEQIYREWDRAKRVASEDYMWRYLHCAVPDYDVAESEMIELLSTAENEEQTELNELLREKLQSKKARIGVKKLRRIEDRLTSKQRRSLAYAIAENSDLFHRQELAWQYEVPFGEAAIIAANFVRDFKPLVSREALAADILIRAKSAVWTDEFFKWLPRPKIDEDPGSNEDALAFDSATIARLGTIRSNRIMR
jgi:predicted KAP-like P-loop ATPase